MYLAHPAPKHLRILDTEPVPTPSPQALEEAQAIWESEKRIRPGLFNGKIFSLDRIEDGVARGFMAEYKWHVAQARRPELASHLRVRSLAVSGLVVVDRHLIFGLRKADLAIEGGLWELAPSGTIHDGLREPDGSLSWRDHFLEELREELGIDAPRQLPRIFALIENTATNIWELGVALELNLDHRDILAAYIAASAPEHSEMAAVPFEDAPRFYKERKDQMVGVCGPLLAAYGAIPSE